MLVMRDRNFKLTKGKLWQNSAKHCYSMCRMKVRLFVALCLIASATAQTTADNAKPPVPAPASSASSAASDPLVNAQALLDEFGESIIRSENDTSCQ